MNIVKQKIMNVTIIFSVVILIIIILIMYIPRNKELKNSLSGFWTGDPSFLKDAELAEMYLYIEPNSGHLVIIDVDGEILSNQAIDIKIKSRLSALIGQFTNTFKFKLDLAFDDEEPMPNRVDAILDPADGSLILYKDETVYAMLIKDNETSTLVAQLEE